MRRDRAAAERLRRDQHPDGRRFWAEGVLSRLADGGLVLVVRDASRRISELATRDHTFSTILDQIPCILSTFDRDLRFTSVQGAGLRAVGDLQTELLGQNVITVLSGEKTAVHAFQAALRGESASFSSVWRGRHYENRVEPLRNAAGEIVGVMNLGLDMTERVLDAATPRSCSRGGVRTDDSTAATTTSPLWRPRSGRSRRRIISIPCCSTSASKRLTTRRRASC